MVSAPQTVKMKSSTPVENRQSILMSKEENEQIFRLLGHRCQSLATAVIQLFLTSPPDHSSWQKQETGVICLVKDSTRKSYFFRLYCPNRKQLIWEQEIYNNIDYKNPCQFLHTFEAEDCMAAFNFANEDEANVLRNALLMKLAARQRRGERRSRSSTQGRNSTGSTSQTVTGQSSLGSSNTWTGNISNGAVIPHHHRSNSAGGQILPAKNGSSKKRRHLTKADIGLPQDFKHISHVGWDPNKGFDIDNADPNLKEFLSKAGVSERQLQDKETREFIYAFINKHGGLDAVKEEVQPVGTKQSNEPPPVPARSNHQSSLQRAAPPPPPARVGGRGPPPPINSRMPPSRTAISNSSAPPPPPPIPSLSNIPPPPPPPPITGLDLSTMDSVATKGQLNENKKIVPEMNDPRTALLESIRSGKALKHVEVERKSSIGDTRGDLLSEIRQGIELRSVQTIAKPVVATSDAQSGLAGALARALAERSRVIHSESDTDSSGSEDEDEWGDD